MLEGYKFLTSSINPKVEIKFPENDHDNTQVRDSSLTDTDLESIDGKNENDQAAKIKIVFSLNPTLDKKNLTWNYLKKDEIPDRGDAQESFTRDLCSKLAKDVFRIANAHKHARTRDSTTCLCVVLRDKKENAKKFVFHNGPEAMHKSMNDKAVDLNYATRTGYQAHAEAEFIQFLLQRMEQNPERYTHILGMGCSRRHCKECDYLMKLFLGAKYHIFTAAMCMEDPTLPGFAEVEDRCCICTKTYHKPVYQSQAVNHNGRRSDKYYLPKTLQEYIQNKAVLNLDFSNERFVIKNEDAMIERRKKRKASTSLPLPGNQE
jgi:hypothetical protein